MCGDSVNDIIICPVCNRIIPADPTVANKHHLTPKSRGGKDEHTILLHLICHNKIHSLWTEKELADTYNTIDMILTHPDMQKFNKWIKNKPIDFITKTKDSQVRRSKRNR